MSKTGQRAGVALLLTVVGFALLWPEAEGGRLNPFEGGEYERIAFNMIHHGQYHDARQLGNGRARPPYVRRAPGYPLFLATVFALSPEFPSLTHACISDTQCDAAVPVRRRVQRLTALIAAVTVAAVFLVAHTWTGSWLISIAAWVFYLILLPSSYIASVLAACLLFVHAVLAAETWRRPRCVTGAVSGIALGLLVLTKAVFQYWLVGVALVCAVGLWWDGSRRRTLLPACLALLLGAGVVTLPWMMRNALQVEHFGISGRSGEVLAIRAEYGRMTWSEVRGAFAFWLPTNNAAVREAALQWLEPDEFGYRRFDRGNPAGFYRRTKNNTGEVAARADRLEPGWRQYQSKDQVAYDAVLARASAELIRGRLAQAGGPDTSVPRTRDLYPPPFFLQESIFWLPATLPGSDDVHLWSGSAMQIPAPTGGGAHGHGGLAAAAFRVGFPAAACPLRVRYSRANDSLHTSLRVPSRPAARSGILDRRA